MSDYKDYYDSVWNEVEKKPEKTYAERIAQASEMLKGLFHQGKHDDECAYVPDEITISEKCVVEPPLEKKGEFKIGKWKQQYHLIYELEPACPQKKNKKDTTKKKVKHERITICENITIPQYVTVRNMDRVDNVCVSEGIASITFLTDKGKSRIKAEKAKTAEKNATIDCINRMIKLADKGVSGFSADDFSGCGNPEIFPEFKKSFEQGTYVYKNHRCCPYNSTIMYGGERRNSSRWGCYYHCSIDSARYMSAEMIKNYLTRFKENLEQGLYDDTEGTGKMSGLLTAEEKSFIENSRKEAEERQRRERLKEDRKRAKEARNLIAMLPEDKEFVECVKADYKKNITDLVTGGSIDFSEDGYSKTVGIDGISYDEYIYLQWLSRETMRSDLAAIYFEGGYGDFCATISQIKGNRVCLEKLRTEGMYTDGICFDGKEDHVWIDFSDPDEDFLDEDYTFEMYLDEMKQLRPGDAIRFRGEVYRYIKKNPRKSVDYSIRKISCVQKIEDYKIPTDEEIYAQKVDMMICDVCMFEEQCNRVYCMANEGWLKNMSKIFGVDTKD